MQQVTEQVVHNSLQTRGCPSFVFTPDLVMSCVPSMLMMGSVLGWTVIASGFCCSDMVDGGACDSGISREESVQVARVEDNWMSGK
jgi:hypothetical protein